MSKFHKLDKVKGYSYWYFYFFQFDSPDARFIYLLFTLVIFLHVDLFLYHEWFFFFRQVLLMQYIYRQDNK